jgi:hypothetical protein
VRAMGWVDSRAELVEFDCQLSHGRNRIQFKQKAVFLSAQHALVQASAAHGSGVRPGERRAG